MKKVTALFMLLMMSLATAASVSTNTEISGTVKSSVSGKFIPYANVIIKDSYLGAAADGNGYYKLAGLTEGKYTVAVNAIGYVSFEKTIVLEANETLILDFILEEDVLELDRVLVTGTRTGHYVKNVPVRTEVITEKDIENKNASNLYEAMEGLPGIRVESQCQYCNFTMIRMQGLGSEHTQVLINGQPLYSGLAGVYGLQQIGTVDVDRIEIVKGAGSALYGSSAVAGAINIITKEPSLIPSTKINVQLGSYNTNRFNVFSTMRNEKRDMGLNIFAEHVTGDAVDETGEGATAEEVKIPDGISDRVESNLTNAGFNLYLYNKLFDNDKLIVSGKVINELRKGGTTTDDYYKNPLTDGTESIETRRYETQLDYTKIFKNNSDLNFSVGFVNHNRNATNDSFLGDYMATHHDSVPDLRDMRPYLAGENSFTATLNYGIKLDGHTLLFGAQAYSDALEESGMYVVVDGESDYYGESYRSTSNKSAREFGAYVQDEWVVSPALTVVPGVRLDRHSSSEEYAADKQVFETNIFPATSFDTSVVNPRLAVKYLLSESLTVRVNVGTGFRAPYGFSEDLHLCSGSPRVWKSSDLKAETSVSYNLSADYYGDKARLSLNLFRTDLKNKIGFVDAIDAVAALGYDYQWENIDDATVQGVEASFTVNIFRHLNLSIDFTYNHGEYDQVRGDWIGTEYEDISKYISRMPETTGNIGFEYKPGTWSISITGDYQGRMYIDYYNEDIDPEFGDKSKIKQTDPFMLVDARVSKSFGYFKLYAGVDNIFDYIQNEKYLDDAAFMYAPMYGRMVYGGISLEIK